MKRPLHATLLLVIIASAVFASEGRRIRLGSVSAGVGYRAGFAWWGPSTPYWGSGMWRPYGPAWWDPFWYGGWPCAGCGYSYGQGPSRGEVRLSSAPHDAMVFLDGAYAGPAGKLRSIWLDTGIYTLEVRDGANRFEKRIYVLSGKILQLRAELTPASGDTR